MSAVIARRRREFIKVIGGVAAVWPAIGMAQQPALPIVAFVGGGTADSAAKYSAAFRKGLSESGYVEGKNVMVEYHWLEGQSSGLPGLMADLVRRRVTAIFTGNNVAALAAKAATSDIPIVFVVGLDRLSWVLFRLSTGRVATPPEYHSRSAR